MSKRNNRSPWLYSGVILILVIFIGASAVPLVAQVLRNRQDPAVATNTPLTAQTIPAEKLARQAEGFELVLEREPNNIAALQGLVEARLEQGQLQEALRPLERLANLSPQQPDYAILLGQAKQHFGDLEGAEVAYGSVLDNYPGYIKALQSLVVLKLNKDRPLEASGLLQTTLKTAAQTNTARPGTIDVASVQMLLGRVYEYQNLNTEAIAVYDQIISQNKEDFRPLWAKADILRDQQQPNAAKFLYNRALELAPPRYKDDIKQGLDQLTAPKAAAAQAETPASADSARPSEPSKATAEAADNSENSTELAE